MQKTSLVDFPGEVCTTLFFGGCNLRCPWCHNADLVLRPSALPEMAPEDILAFLERRKPFIQAVCLTGGEPTLTPGLRDFVRQLKSRGIRVKIDTNGTKPEVIAELLENELLDYVAMDVKGPWEKYELLAGAGVDPEAIKESLSLIKGGRVAYEFRTTVVPGLLTEQDFLILGYTLAGAKRYVLQQFRPGISLIDERYRELLPYSPATLKRIAQRLEPFIDEVQIRS
ncbi:MAG: anaerobic ribonucleoside-triphosphate reductase activating protein [Moorellaceae bacterium]